MNNTAILTAGNAIYSNKRAKKRARIEELTFDPEQRKEYLTGFRKRKTLRQQKAAEFAKEQARKERIETRREIREARKADIEERLKAAKAKLEGSVIKELKLRIESEDDDQTELEEAEIQAPKDSIWENHFEDAEKLTTVTIIEDFDQVGLENTPKPSISDAPPAPQSPPSKKAKTHPESKKKKAFRYGTKAERQSDRKKAKLKKNRHNRK